MNIHGNIHAHEHFGSGEHNDHEHFGKHDVQHQLKRRNQIFTGQNEKNCKIILITKC